MKYQNSFQNFSLFLLIAVVLVFSSKAKSQTGRYANPEILPITVCGIETRTFGATPGRPLTNLNEAREILDEVLATAGIDNRLVDIYEANVGEKLAVSCLSETTGRTVILFDAEKLNEKISNGGNNWMIKSIFAHEAGIFILIID